MLRIGALRIQPAPFRAWPMHAKVGAKTDSVGHVTLQRCALAGCDHALVWSAI